jgi:hypothetical protein
MVCPLAAKKSRKAWRISLAVIMRTKVENSPKVGKSGRPKVLEGRKPWWCQFEIGQIKIKFVYGNVED